MKFSIKDFFSKCDQIRSFLRIWYFKGLFAVSKISYIIFVIIPIFTWNIFVTSFWKLLWGIVKEKGKNMMQNHNLST